MLQREILFPVRVVLSEGNVEGAQHLCTPAPLQSTLSNYTRPYLTVRGKAALVLDFGMEARAGLRIVTRALSSPNAIHKNKAALPTLPVHIRLGESVSECCAELGEKNATNDHSPRDLTAELVAMSDLTFGQSGFRFARIDFPDPECEVSILAIVADGMTIGAKPLVSYAGPDAQLTAIFATAKRTIDLCAAGDYVWDGIKRDRLVWIGDMHPEMLALTTLYGRTPMMDESIRFLRDTTPEDEWMCTIATYSAWWLIVLADYYRMTGCEDLVRENAAYALSLVRRFLSYIKEDGEITTYGLVDWPTHGQPDEPAGFHAVVLAMAKKAAKLFEELGLPGAEEARELERRLLLTPIIVTHSMAVAGLKYFATGELDPCDIELMQAQGANGLSTFMSYYILTAYARYFGAEKATVILKEYYMGMLSRGATTFWEDFHLSWLEGSGRIDELPKEGEKDLHGDYGDFCYIGLRHSLCHAWSTGIIRYLYENGLLAE